MKCCASPLPCACRQAHSCPPRSALPTAGCLERLRILLPSPASQKERWQSWTRTLYWNTSRAVRKSAEPSPGTELLPQCLSFCYARLQSRCSSCQLIRSDRQKPSRKAPKPSRAHQEQPRGLSISGILGRSLAGSGHSTGDCLLGSTCSSSKIFRAARVHP